MSFIGFTSGKGKVLKTDEYNYASGDEYEVPFQLLLTGILLIVFSGFNLFMYLNKVIEKTNILTMLKNGSYVVLKKRLLQKKIKVRPTRIMYTQILVVCVNVPYL